MPYKIEKRENEFVVVKENDGQVMGTHKTRTKARRQVSALYANEDKDLDAVALKSMQDMGGAEYAKSECWDIQQAANALNYIASLAQNEVGEPADIELLADVMYSLLEFIRGEIDEMEKSAKLETVTYAEVKTVNTSPLNLSYAKRLKIDVPDMAVKYVGKDVIKGYTFLWGGKDLTDIELEYFKRPGNGGSNLWDEVLGQSPRPLTWDHAQDETLKASPIIGKINEWGDDELGRWYVAKIERSHKYRKMIDALIEQKALGTSSDSAPQYVKRVPTGKSTFISEWAWFASALTDVPAEPRMIGSLEFIKSLGVILPDTSLTWDWQVQRLNVLKLK